MKTPFLMIVAAFLCCNHLAAQKPFEGSIDYVVHPPKGEKSQLFLTMYFGENALRIDSRESDKPGQTYTSLVLFDSAQIFSFDKNSKEYRAKKIPLKVPHETVISKTIAGHQTKAVTLTRSPMENYFSAFLSQYSIDLYVANDMYYFLPKQFDNAFEFVLIQNNKIVLGAKAFFAKKSYNNDEDMAAEKNIFDSVSLEATSIKPQKLNDNIFKIPQGYAKYDYSFSDTVTAEADSSSDIGRAEKVAEDSIRYIVDSAVKIIDSVSKKNDSKNIESKNQQPLDNNIPSNQLRQSKPDMLKED